MKQVSKKVITGKIILEQPLELSRTDRVFIQIPQSDMKTIERIRQIASKMYQKQKALLIDDAKRKYYRIEAVLSNKFSIRDMYFNILKRNEIQSGTYDRAVLNIITDKSKNKSKIIFELSCIEKWSDGNRLLKA